MKRLLFLFALALFVSAGIAGSSLAVPPTKEALDLRQADLDKAEKALATQTRDLAKQASREAEEKVKKSEGELPYLGAAYLAAFLILGFFVVLTKKSQTRLQADVGELQARLDAALAGGEDA